MNNTEKYIEKYKELESVARRVFKLSESESISYFLGHKNEYRQFRDAISYCQEVRNFLQHKGKVNDAFAIEPSDSMIEFIDQLIERIKNRPHCMEIAIKLADMYWQNYDGNVKKTMRIMREKTYTHVPIIENVRVVGIFDENSIFNEIVEIDDKLSFRDIYNYLSLEGRDMEVFLFCKNMYVDDLRTEFEKQFQKGNRIGVAFITTSGKASDPVLAMVTPWDILGNRDESVY